MERAFKIKQKALCIIFKGENPTLSDSWYHGKLANFSLPLKLLSRKNVTLLFQKQKQN